MVDEADKNHGAESSCDETIGEGKMCELPGDVNCPVASFEKYLSKLRPQIDWLWQRPLDSFEFDGPIWYCMALLGKGKLAGMMGDISNLAHLSKLYTNHCIRATSISELDRNGIEARHLVRVSGHKSEMPIRSYSRRLCDEKQQQISGTLAKALQKKPNVTNKYQQAPINQHPLTETATPGVDISDMDFLEEMFRDDSVFIELEATGKENHPPNVQTYVSDKHVVTQESTNIVFQPVKTTQASSVAYSVFQQVHDNVGTINNHMPSPKIMYNINPTNFIFIFMGYYFVMLYFVYLVKLV